MAYRPIVAIDFDGTIVENAFPKIGKLVEDANNVIARLYQNGCYIIIWTCRKDKYEEDMVNFLQKNNIPFHAVNENAPGIDFTGRKIFANYYVDDRNVGRMPVWLEIEKEILMHEYFKGTFWGKEGK